MAGIKKVLNWFVTIETDEAAAPPPKAASPNPDEAAKAAREEAERRPVGKQPEQPRRVGQVQTSAGGKTLEEELAELDAELAGGQRPSAPPQRPQTRPSAAISARPAAPSQEDAALGGYEPTGEDGDALAPQSFEALYAAQQLPGADDPAFSVYKIERLLASEHLKGLPNEMKRASLLVAMQASNVSVDTIIADAYERDNALDTHDAELQFNLQMLEERVAQQNADIQAEVEAMLRRMQAQIAQNNAQLDEARGTYTSWKQAKKAEEQRLYNAIALFIAPGQQNPVTLDD